MGHFQSQSRYVIHTSSLHRTARAFLAGWLLLAVPSLFGQAPLPKSMTEAERLVWEDYLDNYPASRGVMPPEQIPYTPAEWHEAQAVIMTWADYSSNLREIVRHAVKEVTVYIICSHPRAVDDYLAAGGVDLENVITIKAPFNSVWIRDYGPQSIYLPESNQLAFVDWVYNRPRPADDALPAVMAERLNLPLFQMTQSPYRLIAAGGNFMTDGRRKGFSSALIVEENDTLSEAQIAAMKYRYMGIDPYVKVPVLPYDLIDHIDMQMKLVDEETLLVGQFPEGVSDGPQIEANLAYILNHYQTPYGRPYRVFRIPMPPDENGAYPPGASYLTYTNSLILNGSVLVPVYDLPQDEEALGVYRQAMPGYKVVGINMMNVILANGAIHCLTREIAAADPIFIHHAPIRDRVDYSAAGFAVTAGISSASGISRAALYWKTGDDEQFTEVLLASDQGLFRAAIPSQPAGTVVNYYLKAVNHNGKAIGRPLVAPAGFYSFEVCAALGPSWQFDLDIANGHPSTLTLVQRADAAAGLDDGDLPVSAAPAGETQVWLETAAGTRLAQDCRPPAVSTAWMLQVDARDAANDCVISWDPLMLPPAALYVYEVDAEGEGIPAGSGFPMDEESSLTVAAGTRRYFRLISGVDTFDLNLNSGWNLISVPLTPVDDDPAVVLRNRQRGPVWNWQRGHFAATVAMRPQHGYWVYYPGAAPVSIQLAGFPRLEPRVEFARGWNLIGPGGPPVAGRGPTPLVTVPDHAAIGQIWQWSAGALKPVLQPKAGSGYGVYLSQPAEIFLGLVEMAESE